jgi:hypothetical protein
MTNDPPNRLWADALQQLKWRMDRETFDLWLPGSRVVESSEGALTIGVLRSVGLPWLQHRLRPVIEQTLLFVAGRPIAVDFVPCPQEQPDEYDEDEDETSPADDPSGGATPQRRKKMRRRVSPAATSPSSSPPPSRARAGHPSVDGHKPATELGPNDFYFKVKTAFRRSGLRRCKGAPLSVLNCLWSHVNKDGVAWPSLKTIMKETGYSRGVVCNAIPELVRLRLIAKRPRHNQSTEYVILAYAWTGSVPAPCLFEEQED